MNETIVTICVIMAVTLLHWEVRKPEKRRQERARIARRMRQHVSF